MPVKAANIILPKGATLIEEEQQDPQDTGLVLPKGATLIKEQPVKKKEGGVSPSSSPSPSPSISGQENQNEFKPIENTLPDNEAKALVDERKELQGRIDQLSKPVAAPGGYVPQNTEIADGYKTRLAEIDQRLTNAGYAPSDAADLIGDLPNIPGVSISELFKLKEDNPDLYTRKKAAIKYQSELINAIKNKTKDDTIAQSVFNNLIGGQVSYDYEGQRENTKKLISAVYEYVDDGAIQRKLINEIIKDRMFGYGVNLGGQEESIMNDPRSVNLNQDQVRALQFLEDTDSKSAESFDRLLSLTPQEVELQNRNSSFRLGYQLKAKELEDIGLNLRQRALEEKMNNYVAKKKLGELSLEEQEESNNLYSQWKDVLAAKDQQREKYPMALAADADRLMQDYLGARHSTLSKTLLGIGENVDDAINFAASSIPFTNAKDGRIDDLERFGDKQLGQLSQYDTKEEELFGRAYMPVFSGELKTKLEAIKNDQSLDRGQKEDATREAIMANNFKDISYIANDKSGKFNFTGKAIINSVSNVSSEIVPQIVLAYVTAGGSTASRAQELTSLFTTTFAQAYNDYYTEAISKNISNPLEYAALHTSIEAGTELFGNNIEQARRLFAGTTAGKLLNKATDKEIAAISKNKTGKFQGFLDAIGKTSRVAERNARVEAFEELSGAVLGNTADKYAFNQDVALNDNTLKDFVTTYVGMIPLGALGLPFQYKNVNTLQKRSFYEASTNPAKYYESLDEKVANGTMNQHDAFQIKDRINDGYQALKELNVTKDDGSIMTDNEKMDYLFNKVVQKDIEKHMEEAPDEQKEKLELINNRISRENGLLMKKDGENDSKLLRDNKRLDLKDIDDKISELDEESSTYKSDRNRLEKEKQDIKDYYDNRLKLIQNEEDETEQPVEGTPSGLEPEKESEAKGFVSELVREGILNDVYSTMALKDPIGFLKMISDQAQNVTEQGEKNETDNPEAATRETFGDAIVDYAIELFPLTSKTQSDAIPEQIPAAIDVRAASEDSGEVGTGNEGQGSINEDAAAKEAAESFKKIKTTEDSVNRFLEVEGSVSEKVKNKKKGKLLPKEIIVENNYDSIVSDLKSKNMIKIEC